MAGIRVDQAATTAPVRKNTTVVLTRAIVSLPDAMIGGYPCRSMSIHWGIASDG
jgi:hypothetical protein